MTEHSAETATAPTRRAASTKVATVEKLLSRPKGASLTAIMEATGWYPHSARVFMTGLRNKGHSRFSSSPDQARILMSIQVTRQKASAATGSLAERQEIFRSGAKPPCRFQGQAPIPLMTEAGWHAEPRLFAMWSEPHGLNNAAAREGEVRASGYTIGCWAY